MKAADSGLLIMQPVDARISRLSDVYRMAIYVKDDDYERLVAIKDVITKILQTDRSFGVYGMTVFFDFDPMGSF